MPSDAAIARAAHLRAAGSSWEAVAARLDHPAERLERWPDKYPDRWYPALVRAEQRLVIDSTAEGMLTLRQLLRCDDNKVRRDCATTIVTVRYRYVARMPLPVAPTSPRSAEARRLVAFLEDNADDIPLIPLDVLYRAVSAGTPGGAVPLVEG